MSKHEGLFTPRRICQLDPEKGAGHMKTTLELLDRQEDLLRANRKATATNVIVFEATRILPDTPERRAA